MGDKVGGPSFVSFLRVRISAISSGDLLRAMRGLWFRDGQTLRMSETHIVYFNSDFVVLQSAGDPSVPEAAVKPVTNLAFDSNCVLLTVTGHGYPDNIEIILSNIEAPTGSVNISGFWKIRYMTDPNKIVLRNSPITVVSYGFSNDLVSNDLNLFDSSRRSDIAKMERGHFAGNDDSLTAQSWVMGAWSTSFTDTTFTSANIFCACII